jgi:hypothetical protein
MVSNASGSRDRWAVVAITIGVFVVAACLTVVSLGLRAVMEIGGACSEGGSRVISRPCPQGVTLLVTAAIWIGVGATAWIASWAVPRPGLQPQTLVAPAAAGLLAWNFAEFGLGIGPDRGVNWLWLAIAVMFVAMGVFVLVASRRMVWRSSAIVPPTDGRPVAAATALRVTYSRRATQPPTPRAERRDLDTDKADRVEALRDLHERGLLDEEQYRAALRKASRS